MLNVVVESAVAEAKKAIAAAEEAKETRLTEEEARYLFDLSSKKIKIRRCIELIKEKFGKEVSPATVSRYRLMEKFTWNSAGRPTALTPDELRDLKQAFDRLRLASKAVDAGLLSAIAVGIVERHRPGNTRLNGGHLDLSVSWATKYLHGLGATPRKATTDRTVSIEQIVQGGRDFFGRLSQRMKAFQYKPKYVFNTDEFFVSFDAQTKLWTWEVVSRQGTKRNVSVGVEKAGFTCSILASADGSTALLQFIHEGKTSAVHAGIVDPRVLECHREGSHFQNASTWSEWVQFIVDRIQLPADERALFICDEATQHTASESLLQNHRFDVERVPPSQTHVFQPADQFIIANVKAFARAAWKQYLSGLFSRLNVQEAVKEATLRSVPVIRSKKASFIFSGLQTLLLEPASIVASFHRTGIVRALWCIEPQTPNQAVLFDEYEKDFDLLPDAAKKALIPVTDAFDDDDDDEHQTTEPTLSSAATVEAVGKKRGRPKAVVDMEERLAREKIEREKTKKEKERKAALKELPLKQRRLTEAAQTLGLKPLCFSQRPTVDIDDDEQNEAT